ncbi:MAG: hypothetical protein K6T26_01480 [Alicyclobacillus sp.]|nr:hypothetical protein [Alicyclobacillus sp.]
MHTLLHVAVEVLFLGVAAIWVTLFIATMPGRQKPLNRRQLRWWLVAGVVAGAVCLLSNSLYATPS